MAESLHVAMETYYRGERNKVLLIVAGSALAAAAAVAFYTAGVAHFARGGFYTGAAGELARGFAIGVGGAILPVSLLAVFRWWRASVLARRARLALDTPDGRRAVDAEARRVAGVVVRSLRRQSAALAFGMTAIATAAVLGHPFAVGVAASVLLLVVAEQVLDHYTEERAARYARALGATVNEQA
jgi:hypothetical protein